MDTSPTLNSRANWVFRRKKTTIMFSSQLCFVWMKASLEVYDCKELYKKLSLEIFKNSIIEVA